MPAGVSGVQMRNARIIASVGKSMGMGQKAILIALATAWTESRLMNVKGGHLDSLGLFQQRPSQGWGTPAQVTDPVYASRKFYSTLKQVKGWQNMGVAQAAQAVQRSAFPERYNDDLDLIKRVMGKATGGEINLASLPGGQGTRQISLAGVVTNPQPPAVLAQLALGSPYTPFDADTPSVEAKRPSSPLGAVSFPELGARDQDPMTAAEHLPQMLPMGQDDFINLFGGGEAGSGGVFIPNGPSGKGVHGWRGAVIQAAKRGLGTPYVWGGNSLRNGVDCSGLVQQAFSRAGINLPRISYQQANYGRRVGIKNLKPGDLVAWNNSPRNPGADHIAIYLGNGRIIEAARPGTSVRIRRLGRGEGAWGVRMHA
jgi:hypothetical protein